MRTILYSSFFSAVIFLSSCEEVIEVDLKSSEPVLVVESLITDNGSPVGLGLTKSIDFYKPGNYKKITGATVKLSDSDGNTEIMSEISDGKYQSVNIFGKPGRAYSLEIKTEEALVIANTTMPQKVALDSLDYIWAENPHAKGYMVNLTFYDPLGVKNYYRIRLFRNGLPYKDIESGNEILLFDDKIWDGKKVHSPVKRGGAFFNLSDTVKVQLESIDKKLYDYYNTLKGAISVGPSMSGMGKSMMQGSAAPANPVSNLPVNILGYFGAASISSKTIIIK